MVLAHYEIKDDAIIIPRDELQRWAEHYHQVWGEYLLKNRPEIPVQAYLYCGKTEVLLDLLKHFEPLEG